MMKVEKEKRLVWIVCTDNYSIKGYIHINPGERIIDFINDPKEEFIVVTNAQLQGRNEVRSFKLYAALLKRKEAVILNKSTIRWIMETS